MIGRARRGAEREHLLLEEGQHAVVRQDRRRRLEQKRLVGRAAAFGDEQELVGVLALGIDLDLRRHVVLGVLLLEHGDGRELRIAQVLFQVGVARAFGQRALVRTVGEHQAALLAHDDGGAGVLAHRQHAAGGDVGVLQEVVGDELVVGARLRVVEDVAQLLEVRRAQQVIDVGEGGLGQRAQGLAGYHQHVLAHHLLDRDAADIELAIGGLVGAERKQRRVVVRGDGGGCDGGVHGGKLKAGRLIGAVLRNFSVEGNPAKSHLAQITDFATFRLQESSKAKLSAITRTPSASVSIVCLSLRPREDDRDRLVTQSTGETFAVRRAHCAALVTRDALRLLCLKPLPLGR